MDQTTQISTQMSEPLGRLEQLIAQVNLSNDTQSDLLVEHLQSAKTYLQGAMPTEYEFSLRAAQETAAGLTDADLQKSITRDLSGLLEGAHSEPRPRETARPIAPRPGPKPDRSTSRLGEFLHGKQATLGVFYPTHYIFGAFPSFHQAKGAALALESAGYQALATTAEETARFFDEFRSEVGIWGALMANVSRFFGTEEVFADIDLREVDRGAGFLAVYCPEESEANHISDVVAPFKPMTMQLYLSSGVQTLTAGQYPGPEGNHPEQPQ